MGGIMDNKTVNAFAKALVDQAFRKSKVPGSQPLKFSRITVKQLKADAAKRERVERVKLVAQLSASLMQVPVAPSDRHRFIRNPLFFTAKARVKFAILLLEEAERQVK